MEDIKTLKFLIGHSYRARGGWRAQVIWRNSGHGHLTVVHKPGHKDDERIIGHDAKGKAYSTLSVHAPPIYKVGHPADLIEHWEDDHYVRWEEDSDIDAVVDLSG